MICLCISVPAARVLVFTGVSASGMFTATRLLCGRSSKTWSSLLLIQKTFKKKIASGMGYLMYVMSYMYQR